MVVPPHVPLRNVLEAHTVFVQAVHVPFFAAPDPARYSSCVQLGWSRHAPFLVPLAPARNCDDLQTGWSVHVPFTVAEAEARYWLLVHVGCPAHRPFLVVLKPARYWPELHVGWSTHLNPSVVPPQVPVLCCSDAALHLALEQGEHVPFLVLEAPERKVDPLVQAGWAVHVPLAVLDAEARYLGSAGEGVE